MAFRTKFVWSTYSVLQAVIIKMALLDVVYKEHYTKFFVVPRFRVVIENAIIVN